ncbi:MAG: hypothetical protein IKX97_08815 [Erysipelotrichaceae bacterium]|nr:hypothetical protein [Erysipelotrichaceae bacterium]
MSKINLSLLADVAPERYPGGDMVLPLVLIVAVLVVSALLLKKFFKK